MTEGRDLGPGHGGGAELSRLRVSDQERHAVAEVLREAAGEGRLDLTELEERLEAAYAAKTYADLVPLTSDLPVHRRPSSPVVPTPSPVPVGAAPTYSGSFALMAETRRAGVWQVGEAHWAFALMGSVVLDLREAVFLGPEVAVTANAVMGSVEVLVPPHVVVVVDGVGVMGDYSEGHSKVAPRVGPDSPVVRLRGLALMGSVTARRKELRQQ